MPTAIKISSAVFMSFLLLACGGGESGGSGGSGDSSVANVGLTEMRVASNSCVMSHNAETSIEYLISGVMYKNLVWNCADYDTYTNSKIAAFLEYDFVDLCYKKVSIRAASGICGTLATSPSVPLLDAKISNFTPIRFTYYQSSPGSALQWRLEYNATANNIGNVDAFGLHYDFYIDGIYFGVIYVNENRFALLAIGENKTNTNPFTLFTPQNPSYLDGQQYNVTMTLKDFKGNPLDVSVGVITFESVIVR